eukprot:4337739-Alexandrium_andersonii.AAC.1
MRGGRERNLSRSRDVDAPSSDFNRANSARRFGGAPTENISRGGNRRIKSPSRDLARDSIT